MVHAARQVSAQAILISHCRSASLVAIFIILLNSGIPGAEIAIMTLLAVDRLLDMSRTAVNVLGDSCAAVVIAKSEGEKGILEPKPEASS